MDANIWYSCACHEANRPMLICSQFGMHSDLGKVIQSLLDEFWKSPPVLTSGPTGFP